MSDRQRFGAHYAAGVTGFRVWAPRAQRVEVVIHGAGGSIWDTATERLARRCEVRPLLRVDDGFYAASWSDLPPETLYTYLLDGEIERPDPASRSQPFGVHGPSAVIDPQFAWTDSNWRGLPLRQYIIYELHVGTFSTAGTLDAVTTALPDLRSQGFTAVELMPVAQFSGARNWGYDGVYWYAVQTEYGGAAALKRLVNRAHELGLAVILDVVYNHLGPEGNYLGDFGPYFHRRRPTPWGPAINYDGKLSRWVREFCFQNASEWLLDYHLDGLRLDAIHAIDDRSAKPLVTELVERTATWKQESGRELVLFAESNQNDWRLTAPAARGGSGLDAQWNEDFQRAVQAVVAGDRAGPYADFGQPRQIAQAIERGFVLTGQPSRYRYQPHGHPLPTTPEDAQRLVESLVVYAQNHDQVGNRPDGRRLASMVGLEQLKTVAGLVLLGPGIPLLFMGEEYAEQAPFYYFVDHAYPGLNESIRRGREGYFSACEWAGIATDPALLSTFLRSKLDRSQSLLSREGKAMSAWIQAACQLRRSQMAGGALTFHQNVDFCEKTKEIRYVYHDSTGQPTLMVVANLGDRQVTLTEKPEFSPQQCLLHSADVRFAGPGMSTNPPHHNVEITNLPAWSIGIWQCSRHAINH